MTAGTWELRDRGRVGRGCLRVAVPPTLMLHYEALRGALLGTFSVGAGILRAWPSGGNLGGKVMQIRFRSTQAPV